MKLQSIASICALIVFAAGCSQEQRATAPIAAPSAVVPGEPGGGGVSRPALVGFPARTDTVDFRTQLENKYVSMGRRPAQTIVDMEGEATWVGEYSAIA